MIIIRIKYNEMLEEFRRILIKKGFDSTDAYICAKLYTENGVLERWDGQMGMGNLNARSSISRAIELSKLLGLDL